MVKKRDERRWIIAQVKTDLRDVGKPRRNWRDGTPANGGSHAFPIGGAMAASAWEADVRHSVARSFIFGYHDGARGERRVPADEKAETKRPARRRADEINGFRCKNLIVVIEEPENPRNIGTVIRNVNALGAEKVYVIDPRRVLSDDWQELRIELKLSKLSVSAVKWTFVKVIAQAPRERVGIALSRRHNFWLRWTRECESTYG